MLWRSRSKTYLPSRPTEYPAGTFVESEKGFYYIVSNNKRYRCITKRVLDSWAPARVVRTTEKALSNYRVAAKMKFRNGSLIHNHSDGRIYLISDGKRRNIQSPDVYERLGAVPFKKHVVTVSQNEVNLHQEGEPLA